MRTNDRVMDSKGNTGLINQVRFNGRVVVWFRGIGTCEMNASDLTVVPNR